MFEKDISSNLLICEGFELLGKTKFIKENFSDSIYMYYRPSYDTMSIDEYLPRNERWQLGLSVLDFLGQNIDRLDNKVLILDRSFPSHYVYSRLYPTHKPSINESGIYDRYISLYKKLYGSMFYFYHDDKDFAEYIYKKGMKRTQLDIYDNFTTFDKYWKVYQEANTKFIEFFTKYSMKVCFISSDFQKAEVRSL